MILPFIWSYQSHDLTYMILAINLLYKIYWVIKTKSHINFSQPYMGNIDVDSQYIVYSLLGNLLTLLGMGQK